MTARHNDRNRGPSEYYGALQELVNDLYGEDPDEYADGNDAEDPDAPTVRRLSVVMAAESANLPDDLLEIVRLLPPGDYTRKKLCIQLNSAITGHAWGQVYGTVA